MTAHSHDEDAHRHDPEPLQATGTGDRRYHIRSRAYGEAGPEGAAQVISAGAGFDITGSAAGYIASWLGGNVERLSALHQGIGQVARTLHPPDRLDLAVEAAASRAANQPKQRRTRQARR
jgi:hypothetical protein